MSGAAHCYRLSWERLQAPEAPEEAKYKIAPTKDTTTTTEATTTGGAQ
jgi:hypothetical protein